MPSSRIRGLFPWVDFNKSGLATHHIPHSSCSSVDHHSLDYDVASSSRYTFTKSYSTFTKAYSIMSDNLDAEALLAVYEQEVTFRSAALPASSLRRKQALPNAKIRRSAPAPCIDAYLDKLEVRLLSIPAFDSPRETELREHAHPNWERSLASPRVHFGAPDLQVDPQRRPRQRYHCPNLQTPCPEAHPSPTPRARDRETEALVASPSAQTTPRHH